ncbi:MAG: FtsX-like permease family protein, partial [Tannerella sp.]|nr:FtsX-like permease family protein [Tannerella sp.]
ESAAKALGWEKSAGKKLDYYTVKGVIKNIYSLAPTIAAKPCIYSRTSMGEAWENETVLFKFREGTWETCRDKIKEIIQNDNPYIRFTITNAEDEYDNFLKSENALLKLLSFVSLICVVICIFGFVSLVSLTCEERRKEIAIRKINGATAGNILDLFFREYFLLLVAGAAVAFPVGYYIMRLWLEQYVRQTSISAWIYLSILSALVLVIVLCVGWRVYKASVENPAEVIKL